MKELIKRFIDCNVPTQVCNLKCPYCYVGQVDGFSGKIRTINHTPKEVRMALSKKRMGGIILINFCGTGETLLGDEILPIVLEVLKEGHFVQVVTNGTISKRFDEISSWDKEYLSRLFIKFSYHYTELQRLGLLETFFDNITKVREAGCSFSVEITSGDEMAQYIDDMKEKCIEKCGALPHITVARNNADSNFKLLTDWGIEDYTHTWDSFDSELFDLKMKLYGEKQTEFCYGGEWTFYLYLSSGDLKQCYRGEVIDNIFEDVNKPIHFRPIGKKCCEPYCFNGHAWLTLGSIPGQNYPTYDKVRNRTCADGSEWLNDRVKRFFSHRLEENNIVYSNNTSVPKVVLLGDSISKGYREFVLNKFIGEADVFFPEGIVSSSTNMLRYISEIACNLAVGSNIDFVYFNIGLWDILRLDGDEPLIEIDSYKRNMIRIINRIRAIFPNARVIFATTTPVKEELSNYNFCRLNSDVERYNEIACEVMNNMNVEVHDLNEYALNMLYDDYVDFTHFSQEGYSKLAEYIYQFIKNKINECKKESKKESIIVDDIIRNDYSYLKDKKVYVYGAGDYGERVLEELKKIGIIPVAVCDVDEKKQGQSLLGVNIISPESFRNNYFKSKEDIIIISIRNPITIAKVVGDFAMLKGLDICTFRIFSNIEQ